jgi:hypothetical protein
MNFKRSSFSQEESSSSVQPKKRHKKELCIQTVESQIVELQTVKSQNVKSPSVESQQSVSRVSVSHELKDDQHKYPVQTKTKIPSKAHAIVQLSKTETSLLPVTVSREASSTNFNWNNLETKMLQMDSYLAYLAEWLVGISDSPL